MRKFTAQKTVEYTAQEVAYVLDAGLGSDCLQSWCTSINWDKLMAPTHEDMLRLFTEGMVLELATYYNDTYRFYTLGVQSLVQAMAEYDLSIPHYDSYQADKVIQIALFGEVRYA